MFRLTLLAVLLAPLSHAAAPLAARWEGIAKITEDAIPCVFDLAQDGAGQWSGYATLPGFGVKAAPLADITIKDSSVEFTIPGALGGSRFKGKLTAAGKLDGVFEQGGNKADLELARTGEAQLEKPASASTIDKDAFGEWEGECNYMDRKTTIRLSLTSVDGKPAAKIKLIRTRENDLPEVTVMQEAQWLVFRSAPYGITVEGRLGKSPKEITGVLEQGNIETPLVLHPKS